LLTGAPVESLRRRLKYASISFEQVLLEAGVYTLRSGPGGSSAFLVPVPPEEPRWQTPAQRRAAKGAMFGLNIGRELTPGVAAPVTHGVLASETAACWTATLYPFARELPEGTDWIGFTRTRDPAGDMRRLIDEWRWADEHNVALERAIPEQFLRAAVIGHANRDLGYAARQGMAVSVDLLHARVVAERFNDDGGWKLQGFAVPVLLPRVSEMPWKEIAELRRDRDMARLRAVLREVEEEATAEAADGDVEQAAHHAYERHLAAASGLVDNLGAAVKKTGASMIVSAAIGAATMPMTGVLGLIVGTAAGGGVAAVTNARSVVLQRRSKGWVSLVQRIDQLSNR
jgi:hypothetical protein